MEQNTINNQSAPYQAPGNMNNPEINTPIEPVAMPAELNKKNISWQKVTIGAIALLAVFGVGFGIWAIVDRDSAINELHTQITNLQNQNTDLNQQVEELATEEDYPEAKEWSSTEVQDGVFYVVGENGEAIVHSDPNEVVVNEVIGCESSSGDTILTCAVQTSRGEGWFLYDVYGDSLASSFDEG